MTNKIELKNISKKYFSKKKISVLKNINFKFKSGKIYSLMGPSGSGKSTLLNILSLIDKPSSGKLVLEGNEIFFNKNELNDSIRAKKIGIIYQDKNLLSDFTALENVYLPRLTLGNNKISAIEEAKKIIKKMGLINRISHYPSELSGGEMQRIAISRALINSPEIILADEPTGSLDLKTSKEIFNILFKLRSKKRVIIFATHNRYFADLADCKMHLINGKIKVINARIRKKGV
tara:strand:+ start:11476 stop:12174 length:699 start_codon:yes stop_codon:yes gene_type:complete